MILQALVRYYQAMSEKGIMPEYGWGPSRISYVLCLSQDGGLEQVISQKIEGSKNKMIPRMMNLPAAVKRSSGIAPNFLWDNASYVLGIDAEGKTDRSVRCFEAYRELHRNLLAGKGTPETEALLKFLEKWEPDQAGNHPALAEEYADIVDSSNLVFRFNGRYLHEYESVKEAWHQYYQETEGKATGICLVTGHMGPVSVLHPSIKGIPGAQSSGASLVSFNAKSLCSYGLEQGENASTSEYASFAYGAALNYLISEKNHAYKIGDTMVLCWAEGGEKEYPGLMGACFFGEETPYSEGEVMSIIKSLSGGKPVEVDGNRLDPDHPFYMLGISANAARLSVRFFFQNSFGNFLRNVQEHYERLEIQRPSYDTLKDIPIGKLLWETVNKNAKNKSVPAELASEVLSAILINGRYPATLLNGITLRIRSEKSVTRRRAAMIKAYYLKNTNPDVPKEVLTVSLNKESTNIPYQLGRLFAVLEKIQSTANPELNSTIRDKYFNTASSTPATVFPVLVNLAQKHLKKIKGDPKTHKLVIAYEKKMEEILGRLGEEFPVRLNFPQQGSFQLGYYHQKTAHFAGEQKEDE